MTAYILVRKYQSEDFRDINQLSDLEVRTRKMSMLNMN